MAIIQLALEYKMKRDIINKLKNSGFIDGVNLENHLITDTDTTFWQHILNNTKAAKNKSYIVYEIVPERDKVFGDGEAVISELSANINLYTINTADSEATFALRTLIEEEFNSEPWKIEFNLYEYDKDTRLNHYSYTISSIYGSD